MHNLEHIGHKRVQNQNKASNKMNEENKTEAPTRSVQSNNAVVSETIESNNMSKNNKEFNQGVIWACARLIELHDQPEMAYEVFQEANIHDDEIKRTPEYDLEFLRRSQSGKGLPKGVE